MSGNDVCAALVEVIGAGVVPQSELDDRLTEAGYRISGTAVERRIQIDTRFFELGDGVGYVPAFTEGVGFSVWVDPETAAENYLLMKPALDVIGWWIVECPIDVFDEADERIGAVESDGWLIDEIDTDVVVGPEGWLDPFADSWVAFRVRQGTLVIERLAGPPPVDPARAVAVRTAFDAVAELQLYRPHGSEPLEVMRSNGETVLQEAMRVDGPLFAGEPLPLSADLFAAAGLRIEDPWVVPDDLDPETFAAAEAERRSMTRWGVDAETVVSAHILLGAISLHGEGSPVAFGTTPEEQEMAPVLFEGLLGRTQVAQVIAYECSDAQMCEAARGFARTVAAVFEDDPSSWAMRWLEAHCAMVLGDVDAAAVLLDGLPSDGDHLPLLIDRARLAIERSQAKDAHRLLQAAERLVEGLPDLAPLSYRYGQVVGELHEEVEHWAATTPGPTARRNERCPCGSGRKYKVCHLGRELHPIEERSAWLYQKMARFVRAAEGEEINSLGWVWADAMDSPGSWSELVDMPFIPDLVLHEEQVKQRFLDGRVSTLPDDEVLLAQQWMLVDRSVFEVQSADDGGVLALYDIATGDAVEVSNLGDGPALRAGMIVIGRPLPVGDTYRAFSGFMTLRPDLVRDALSALETKEPDAIVELLGAMHRPRVIRNTDGHDMVPTEITWSLPNGADVTDGLMKAGFADAGDSWTLVRDTANQSDAVIASLRMVDDTIVGSVNSAERAEEVVELLAEHVPDAQHVNTEVLDLDDVDEANRPAPNDQAEMLANPEIRAAMEAHMANYEAEWLDNPVPALKGLTPRDAAADPIAREELIRLLALFPEVDEGDVGMSPARLRDALGL